MPPELATLRSDIDIIERLDRVHVNHAYRREPAVSERRAVATHVAL